MNYYYIILILLIFIFISIFLFLNSYYYNENFTSLLRNNYSGIYERDQRKRVNHNKQHSLLHYSKPLYDNVEYYNENEQDYNENANDHEYSSENIFKKKKEKEREREKKEEEEEEEESEKGNTHITKTDNDRQKYNKIIIDGISCSQKDGSTIIGFSNTNNKMYISKDYGNNWVSKNLPENQKWSKIYLLEVRKERFKLILFGINKNIYLSTDGDFWNHISILKGYDLVYSEDYNYIYISTNKGILINNNEGLIASDTQGCTYKNLCSGFENYNKNYNGVYKFKEINDVNVKNKDISSIACTPDGNIIIVGIRNEKIIVGKIKKVQERKFIDKKEEDKEKAKWKYEYKESDKNIDNYYDESGNLIWIFYSITNNDGEINSIGVIEQIKKSKLVFGNNKNLYEYEYDKSKKDRLEEKIKELKGIDKITYKCDGIFPCHDIKKDVKSPEYLISKIIVYKIGYVRSYYAIINNIYIYYEDESYKKHFEMVHIQKNIIKDLVINNNGSKGYLLSSNGIIYKNNDLRNYFNKENKSEFSELKIKINNTT